VFFMIDGIHLTCDPLPIDIVPAGAQETLTSDRGVIVVEDQSGIVVTVTFGAVGGNIQRLIAELESIRNTGPIHEITFEDIYCNRLVTINAYMNRVPRNVLTYDVGGNIIYSQFSIPFRQVEPPAQRILVELWSRGTISATGDGKYKWSAPSAGKIVQVEGFINTLGTGAGQTRFQIRNATSSPNVDYLSTPGDFVVASATKKLENQVLITSPSFYMGDEISLDCDDIPGGADSANACIQMWVELQKAVWR